MKDLKVIKRNGGTEPWNDDKIITSIGKSGLDIKKAEDISKGIKIYFKNNSPNSEVASSEIRDKVLEELKDIDPVASESYKIYKKQMFQKQLRDDIL